MHKIDKQIILAGIIIISVMLASFYIEDNWDNDDDDWNPPPPPPANPEWVTFAEENHQYVVWVSNYACEWEVEYNNGTFSNTSATFVFYFARCDTNSAFIFDTAYLNGQSSITYDNVSYEIIAKGIDGLYEFDWKDDENHIFNEEITFPFRDERAGYMFLNVTLNPKALVYNSFEINPSITIAVADDIYNIYISVGW